MTGHLLRGACPQVVVLGDVMLDVYWHGSARRLSPEAPVPVVDDVREERRAGGAANVAVQLAALGWDVTLVGVVGTDEPAAALAEAVSAQGVRPALVADPGRLTTVKQRILAEGQQLLRVDRESSVPVPTGVEAELVDLLAEVRPRVVVVSDYAKGVLTARVAAAICTDAPVVVDTKRTGLDLFRDSASVLTSNEAEVRRATGANSLAGALGRARTLLPSTALLVTRGQRGMVLDEPGRPSLTLPSNVGSVVDVTGAGDIVTAYVAHGLAEGWSLDASARLANAAAGVGVRRLGAATVELQEAWAAVGPSPDWMRVEPALRADRPTVPA